MSATPTTDLPGKRPSTIVRAEVRDDGVAIVTLDDPGEPFNTLTPAFGEELTTTLDSLEQEPRVRAIVLRGKRDSFLVGANIDHVRAMRFAQDAADASREVGKRFARLGTGAKPVVACVHGPALGGGFELSLACTAAIASDDPKTAFGLPEVKLGLMPAANGLLRIAERAGLETAIDLGLSGRSLRPTKALALGLVDEIVRPAQLLDAAVALAKRLASDPTLSDALRKARRGRGRGPTPRRAGARRALLEKNPLGRALLFRRARIEARNKTGGHHPAPEHILEVLRCFAARGFARAADLEPKLFGDLVVSETAHRLIDLFFAGAALKKDTGLDEGEKAASFSVAEVAVVGAGLTGAEIAAITIQAGLPVRMKDRDDGALGRGLRQVEDALDARVHRGSISALERDAIFGRLSGAIDYAGLRDADVVLEAVFEDVAHKQAVVRDVERCVKSTCVIASSTMAIPIATLAEGAARPEMVVGMRYASAVPKMPLLEVVRTPAADPRAIATAVALGRRQGRMVIVVRDGTAFYTTRLLVPYMNEALHLVAEGIPIDVIDRAMVDWGFSVGPLQLLDEVGIDVAADVSGLAEAAFGERLRPPQAFGVFGKDGRRGRKSTRGIYRHERRGAKVDLSVYTLLHVTPQRPQKMAAEAVQLRCALALVNEALRAYGEKIVRSPRDGDIGAIFGFGFPSFRGGPFRYVDAVGADEILRRTRSLEDRLGSRFEPAPILVDMARRGGRFYD